MRKILLITLLILIGALPIFALAQKIPALDCKQYCDDTVTFDPPENQVCICNPIGVDTFEEVVEKIINFLLQVAIVLTPLMVLIGGFLLAMSAGDPQKSSQAKNLIIWALIGFAIILFAKAIMSVILQLVKVG